MPNTTQSTPASSKNAAAAVFSSCGNQWYSEAATAAAMRTKSTRPNGKRCFVSCCCSVDGSAGSVTADTIVALWQLAKCFASRIILTSMISVTLGPPKLRASEPSKSSRRSDLDETARKMGVALNTVQRWRAKFGGMTVSEAQEKRRLKDEEFRQRFLRIAGRLKGGRPKVTAE